MMITQPIDGSGNVMARPGASNVPKRTNSQTPSENTPPESAELAEAKRNRPEPQAVQVDIQRATPRENPKADVEASSQEQVLKRVQEMVDRIRQRITTVNFQIESDSNEVIVRVVNKETGETVRQLPPEEVLRLRESLADFKGALISEVT